MSYRRVQKEKKATNYRMYGSVTRYGPQSVAINLLRLNDVPRTSRTFFPKRCNISSVLSIFKYNPGKTNNKFIISR